MVETKAMPLSPDEMDEGGAVPWNRNCKILSAKVVVFAYGERKNVAWDTPTSKEAPVACGIELRHQSDDGTEFNAQFYSFGDPAKYVPSKDGAKPADEGPFVIPNPDWVERVRKEGTDEEFKLSKSSNGGILIAETINAGFPKNRVGSNITEMFEGLYGFWVSKPIKREGLTGKAADKPIPVPSKIEEGSVPKKGKGKLETVEMDEEDVLKTAMKLVKAALKKEDSITRADLAQAAIDSLEKDEGRDAVSTIIFEKSFTKALKEGGYELDDETITKEED